MKVDFGRDGVSSSARGIAESLIGITAPASWWIENGNLVIFQQIRDREGQPVNQTVVIPKSIRMHLALDIIQDEAKPPPDEAQQEKFNEV